MIDALRGIAAVMVLLSHCFDLAIADKFGWNYADTPAGWRLARATIGHGGFWVWSFFMISGICIHRSIMKGMQDGTFSWRTYGLARLTRIYPLFLLGLLLAVITWLLHEDFGGSSQQPWPWRQFLASIAGLHIMTCSFPGFETSWSLSCELIYYAAWPVLLRLVGGSTSKTAFVAILGSLAGAALILMIWKGLHQMEHSASVDGMWTTLVLFPVWVSGAWMAAHWQHGGLVVSRNFWLGSFLLCLLSELLLATLKFKQYPGWALHLAGLSAIPGLMFLLSGAGHLRLLLRPAAQPSCRWLGRLSYPCYILHLQILLLINYWVNKIAPDSITKRPVVHSVVEFVLVLALLSVIGPRLESFFLNWRAGILARAHLRIVRAV
ncbi:acyltransferase family protein [Brevifollis gellanilyticus]|uniref:Acyltransferase 3 domain-containing protein n=1 Tax=Brevifollis gellanilyticus TaxID=748831 RepID=A0A512MD10_9BACT|nr:acyltransferase [Brevifollis gellanilyticus]GEP44592.1 hypothetical protein BGE01nite_38830 [Brevifollis gellanilyticus]